ncbi:MAG: hypothetical protein AAB459_01445 [Patescibacteria group bacterium]
MAGTQPDDLSDHGRLMSALAEQLKLPLVQIAHGLESGAYKPQALADNARLAIKLIDSYLLTNTHSRQESLLLEPVPLSAVLQDVAHQLYGHAKRYNCQVELNIAGRYQPVMSHKNYLQGALLALGYSFIEAASNSDTKATITLAAHRTKQGISGGVFGLENLRSEFFRKARQLYGTANQPLTSDSASSSVGMFIADTLLGQMNTPLHVARHQNQKGLAATFIPSTQLKLV